VLAVSEIGTSFRLMVDGWTILVETTGMGTGVRANGMGSREASKNERSVGQMTGWVEGEQWSMGIRGRAAVGLSESLHGIMGWLEGGKVRAELTGSYWEGALSHHGTKGWIDGCSYGWWYSCAGSIHPLNGSMAGRDYSPVSAWVEGEE